MLSRDGTSKANGKLKQLSNDYDTIEGVRDYIHVMDAAAGLVAAIEKLPEGVHNRGTGQGASVLELAHTFENVVDNK